MSELRLSRDEVRAIDRRAAEEFGLPTIVLMENAGRGASEVLLSLGASGPVVICCGKGNNGGDGFVVARHLDISHVPVRILLFARPEELTGDALVNYHVVARSGIPLDVRTDASGLDADLARAEWIVDALFGTGLTRPVESPWRDVIAAINRASAKVFSLDLPSGLDCDTGRPLGDAVLADHTVTFVAAKKGFAEPSSRAYTGTVHVVGIGVPRVMMP